MAKLLGRSKSLHSKASPKDQGTLALVPDSGKDDIAASNNFGATESHSVAMNPKVQPQSPDVLMRPRMRSGSAEPPKQPQSMRAKEELTRDDNTPRHGTPSPKRIYYALDIPRENSIGIALGSPAQSPWKSVMASYNTDYVTSAGGTVTNITSEVREGTVTPRPKVSRWRSIFGRKPSPSPANAPFYQAQQPSEQLARDRNMDLESLNSSTSSPDLQAGKFGLQGVRKKNTASKEPKAGSRNAPPMPVFETSLAETVSAHSETGRNLHPKTYAGIVRSIPKLSVPRNTQDHSSTATGSGLLLDIDIPSIEMERYSVMFGSLLKPDLPSSLLERRQGNVDKLKPLNEFSRKNGSSVGAGGVRKLQRRATSPSAMNSPRFSLSLFPPLDSRTPHSSSPKPSNLHRPRPLQRSYTTPGNLSPARRSFALSDGIAEEFYQESSVSETGQQLIGTPSTFQTFDEESLYEDHLQSTTWKPLLEEPAWEMVPKPSAAQPDSTATKVVESDVGNGAQISIARTVSVSRPRDKLVRPGVLEAERMVDRKPLTPTVVELQNRKSQRVQLVTA